jgi:PAS domain S-box-containing protein
MSFFGRFYLTPRHFQPGSFNAYLLAVVLVATATAGRVALGSAIPGVQFISLFPAVIATALICGMTAGFFSVAMGAVCAWFFILPPTFSFRLESVQKVYLLLFFVVIASAIVLIIGAMRTAIDRVRRLNQTFTTVFEANPDAILLTNRRGRITNVNERAAELFRTPREALIGAPVDSLLPERVRDRHASLHSSYMADPRRREMGAGLDLTALRGDGTEFPVDIQIGPIEIDDETLGIAIVRDLTEHKALSEELARSRQQQAVLEERQASTRALRTALESTTDSVAVFDRTWRFTYLNERATAQLARGSDLLGQVVWDAYPTLAESVVGVAFRAAMESGLPTHADDHFAQTNAHFDAHAYPSKDGLTVFFRDVTDERETVAALARSEAQREVAQERAAHAERVQALGQLAGGIAHDFNNVLQVVKGVATLIERRPGDEPGVARLARLAMEATERGASITRRLLAFGRRGDLRAETLDVVPLLNSLHEIFVHTLGPSIEVHIELGPDLPPLFADKAQLETVLVNLATNARDAMPQGGRLIISALTEVVSAERPMHPAGLTPGRYVRLTIVDSGTGMDAKTLAHAHEPFFTTKEVGAGTGLGLPMARGFAEQSGGALRVESSPGQGTTVTLWLPEDASDRSPQEHGTPTSQDMVGAAAPRTAIATKSVRVLVVDDEDLLREVLAQNLEDRGYDVLVAASGPEAIALLATGEAVDALVTDMSMPGMDGLAVIRAAQKRHPRLPAVLLTGYVGDESALVTGAAITGAYSLAHKPISTDDLVDRIEALLAAQPSPLANTQHKGA